MSQGTISKLLDAAFLRLLEAAPGDRPDKEHTRRELAKDMVRILHAARVTGADPVETAEPSATEATASSNGAELPPAEGAEVSWRCFHCNDHFLDRQSAALHFGRTEYQSPACQVSPERLRELEEQLRRYQEDDTDLHRQLFAQQSAEHGKLRRAEEDGYARGLRDAVKFPIDARGIVRYGVLPDGSLQPEGQGTFVLARDLVEHIAKSAAGLPPTKAHSDDRAVDRFALALKTDMAAQRIGAGIQAENALDWLDGDEWSFDVLALQLADAVKSGDSVRIGAVAMMLHQREALAFEHHPCNGGSASNAIRRTVPASIVADVLHFDESRFESWWESRGCLCRSGGGDYEKTFAYRAWERALAQAAELLRAPKAKEAR